MTESMPPPHPTRIFLSYARGDDEAFVRRLHDNLVAAGFNVWFDRESLLSRGLTFHQEIKDAIRIEVDRVVYVGGPKAVASLYVREEWKSALEYDHVVVTPILRLGDYETCVPGELALLHCEDFRDDAQYPSALAKLIESLRQPNPPLGALHAVPNLPPHFIARPDLLRRVRDALLVDLQKPQVITGADAKVGVQGMGGIGKSVLAAALARDRRIRESYPDGIVWIACGQRLGERDLVLRMRDLVGLFGGDDQFNSLSLGQGILRPLLHDKAVLLILDDVWTSHDAQAFDVLGPRCRMLVTTRDAGILHTLGGERVPVSLFTEAESLQLLADAIATKERPVTVADLPPEAHEVARECGCLPLALALCGGMAKSGHSWRDILDALREADLEWPEDRERPNIQHRTIWNAMKVSYDALPETEKPRFLELSVFSTDSTVPEAAVHTLWNHTGQLNHRNSSKLLIHLFERSLVQLDSKTDAEGRVRRRFRLHDLLYDFATRIAGDKQALHETLLDAYRAKCPRGWASGPNDGYFLQQLGAHLAEAGQWDELEALLTDLAFLEAKVAAGLTFELPGDFGRAIATLPPERPARRILKLLDEAIRRDINFIARHATDYPQALFQCAWNHGWWYDCNEAAKHYEGGVAPGRLPSHGAGGDCGTDGDGTGSGHVPGRLCVLLERWRGERERAAPEFAWVRSRRPPPTHLGTALRAVLRGHEHYVNSVAFSPDGRRIVSGSGDNTVRVWDAESGAEVAVLRGHKDWIRSVAFSPDGRRIVSGSGGLSGKDKTVRVWDAESGAEVAVLRGHEDLVRSVAFSRDGRRIVSGSDDNTVRVWDAESGAEVAVLRGHNGDVNSVAFSPDGRRIVSGSDDKTIRLWDAESGAEVAVLWGHEYSVNSVAFSPDGRRIVSGSDDDTVRVWDAESGAELAVLRGHEDWVRSVSFSPDGRRIVSGSGGRESWGENTVRVWDAESGAEVAVLRGHEDDVQSVAFSPDGRRIVSGSDDKTVRVWDAESGAEVAVLRGHEDDVQSVAFSPDGRRIVSGSDDKTVRVWDAESGAEVAVLRGHEGWVRSVAFSPDWQRIVSGSADKTVRIWDTASCKCLVVLHGHKREVTSVAFSPDRTCIVSGSLDGTVRLWDAVSGECLPALRGHEDWGNNVAFSPDGALAVSGSDDNTVQIWDVASGEQLAVLHGHENLVKSVAFSPDGARIVSGSRDKTLRLWDVASGKCQKVLHGHDREVTIVAFSPDGARIISGSQDSDLRLWDSTTGKCLDVLCGHYRDISSVAFSLDSAYIASGGDDIIEVIRLWDATTGKCLDVLRKYEGDVHGVAFSPDGTRIFFGADDNTMRLWDTRSGECLHVIQGSGDVAAIAAGPDTFPFRALRRGTETEIEDSRTGNIVARFPAPLEHIITHPRGRVWAGKYINHLYLIALEGPAS